VECYPHTVEVTGSNPVSPTIVSGFTRTRSASQPRFPVLPTVFTHWLHDVRTFERVRPQCHSERSEESRSGFGPTKGKVQSEILRFAQNDIQATSYTSTGVFMP